jgi:chromosome transmission fidelity protein 18
VIRPEEKAVLSHLVNIMTSLELRFVQERADDGQRVYKLDPWVLKFARADIADACCMPADIFVTYDGKRACVYSAAALRRATPCCYGG